MGFDPRDGSIRPLTPEQPLRRHEIGISEREAKRLMPLSPEDRAAELERIRSRLNSHNHAKRRRARKELARLGAAVR